MEKQLSKIEVSEPAKTPANDERLIRNILLLHFKQGLPAESIGHIFSISLFRRRPWKKKSVTLPDSSPTKSI